MEKKNTVIRFGKRSSGEPVRAYTIIHIIVIADVYGPVSYYNAYTYVWREFAVVVSFLRQLLFFIISIEREIICVIYILLCTRFVSFIILNSHQ